MEASSVHNDEKNIKRIRRMGNGRMKIEILTTKAKIYNKKPAKMRTGRKFCVNLTYDRSVFFQLRTKRSGRTLGRVANRNDHRDITNI